MLSAMSSLEFEVQSRREDFMIDMDMLKRSHLEMTVQMTPHFVCMSGILSEGENEMAKDESR